MYLFNFYRGNCFTEKLCLRNSDIGQSFDYTSPEKVKKTDLKKTFKIFIKTGFKVQKQNQQQPTNSNQPAIQQFNFRFTTKPLGTQQPTTPLTSS
jgi:hypothetical protein